MRHIYKGRLRQAYSYVIPVVATLLVCVGFCIIALSIAKREDAKMQDRTAAYVAHNLDTQFKNIKTYSNEVLNSKDMFSLSQAYISGAGDEQEIQIETNLMSNIYRYCSSMDLAENILLYYPKRDRIISKYGSLTTRQFFVLNNEEMLLSPELLQARIDDVFDRRHGEVYSVENSCSGITEYYYFACVPNNSTLDSCEWAMALQISPTALSKLLSEMTQTMNIAFAAITTQDGHIFSHTDMEQDAVSLRHKQVWPQDRDKSAMMRYESLTKMDLYLLFDTSASYHLLRSLSLIMSGGLILAALMGLVLALISQGMREQRVEKLVRRLGGEKGTTLNDAVEGFLARAYQENLQNVRALDHQRALVRYSFLKELLRASRLDEGRLDLLCTAYDMSFEGDGFSLFCLQQEGEGGERSKDAVFDFLTERGYSEYVVFWTRMENIDCFLCNYAADKNGRQMMEQFKAELNTTFHTHCYGTAAPSDSGNSSGGVSIFDNPYLNEEDISSDEALGEENYIDPYDTGADTGSLLSASGASGGVETVYPYAGATPIPLDPVDLPTPTPHPELTFDYATYTAGSLGLTFDCPSGWLVDESQTDVFVLTEPETQMHDGQQCIITISAEPVTANYSEKDLKKQVTQRLKEIGSVNFTVWNPSLTATRTLLDSKGVYANYTGTLANGVELAGRILYASTNNKLYGVEMVYPRDYRDDYLNIFAKIRETISAQ